jgi:nitrogen fixation/metabolism regulation signal transduction histidine kinase
VALANTIKRFFAGQAPIILLIGLLLGSLYMMSIATQNSEQFSRLYIPLLLINVVELLILAGLILVNLGRLLRQYRNHATGSRLTVRLVVLFVVLAVGPVSVLYYFSLGFVRHGIDSWFDVRVDKALKDALNLSRTSLDWRMRDMMRQARYVADSVSDVAPDKLILSLNEMRRQIGAYEVTLMTLNGKVISFSSEDPTKIAPVPIDHLILSQLQTGLAYVGIDPAEGGLYARLVVNVPSSGYAIEPRVLQALFKVPEGINDLVDSVQTAYAKHEQLIFLSGPLKFSFVLTLSIILLLSIFTAVWAAFFLAQRLVAPIRVLAIGTRAVAQGDYHRRLPLKATPNDELGFLVKSFNTMMGRIARAQDEAETSQQNLETQKLYLETVLGHLSSGVMTFNSDGVLRTANAAAGQILGSELNDCIGKTLEEITTIHPHVTEFVAVLGSHFEEEAESWQAQAVVFGAEGRQLLMCRGAPLPEPDSGHVVVFDDVTALIRAQRDAAWGEVARRLAHEIKNPLTPIQLSAERLRHKYLPMMPGEENNLLDRSTHTIIQQVESMKEMVKAFSDYARSPRLQLQSLRLNELINEVLELYRDEQRGLRIETRLDPRLGLVDLDNGRMRQLLHNLLKNAIEALGDQADAKVVVETRLVESGGVQAVELYVEDNGGGIPAEMLDKLFEPYVSSKHKGSGLGLAIVKKIVEEHNGVIWVENVEAGGARFTIRLPLKSTHKETGATDAPNDNSEAG